MLYFHFAFEKRETSKMPPLQALAGVARSAPSSVAYSVALDCYTTPGQYLSVGGFFLFPISFWLRSTFRNASAALPGLCCSMVLVEHHAERIAIPVAFLAEFNGFTS